MEETNIEKNGKVLKRLAAMKSDIDFYTWYLVCYVDVSVIFIVLHTLSTYKIEYRGYGKQRQHQFQ